MSGDVLVVEDDRDLAAVMRLALESAGHRVRTARHGQEALDLVAADRPALVLLDMMMPVMDGWRCAAELRSCYGRSLPIIVVTASELALRRGADVDADATLAKPFELEDLLELVDRHLPG